MRVPPRADLRRPCGSAPQAPTPSAAHAAAPPRALPSPGASRGRPLLSGLVSSTSAAARPPLALDAIDEDQLAATLNETSRFEFLFQGL